MTQFKQVFAETSFISGMVHYQDHYPRDTEKTVRIVIQAFVNNKPTPFIVDTGAPWCVIDPKITGPLIENGQAEPLQHVGYVIRGCKYTGRLFRIPIILGDKDDGVHSVEIEASVFVPTLQPDEEWLHPNFLGLDGFLNRMRFAVDPEENAFYFGRI